MNIYTSAREFIRNCYPGSVILLNEPLKKHTSFRIGGPVPMLVIPDSKAALIGIREYYIQHGISPLLIGRGTNILAEDCEFDFPVIKTTSSLLAFTEAEPAYDVNSPCIHCGKCVEHCPMRLMPNKLSDFAQKGDAESAEKYSILDCMQCGMCSYVCPARRHPLANIRTIRPVVIKNIRKRKEAAQK